MVVLWCIFFTCIVIEIECNSEKSVLSIIIIQPITSQAKKIELKQPKLRNLKSDGYIYVHVITFSI
jgi:hypothetical protein